MLNSWEEHVVDIPDMFVSLSTSSSQKPQLFELAKKYPKNKLFLTVNDELYSEFENVKQAYKELKTKLSEGHLGGDADDIWVLFSQTTGIWSESRSFPYNKLFVQIAVKHNDPRSYSSMFASPGHVTYDDEYTNKIRENICTSENVTTNIASGILDKIGNETELSLYCVRLPILGIFLREASSKLLAHKHCAAAFTKFLAFNNSKILNYVVPAASSWLYCDRGERLASEDAPSLLPLSPLSLQVSDLAKTYGVNISNTECTRLVDVLERYCALFPTKNGTVNLNEAEKYLKFTMCSSVFSYDNKAIPFLKSAVEMVVNHPLQEKLIRSPKLIATSLDYHDFQYLTDTF